MGDGIFSKVDAARFLNLLHLKGHECRKAFCGHGAEGVNLPGADGQSGVHAVKLLITHDRHLAYMVGSYFQQSIRVGIQLFLGIRKVDQGQHGQHHSLIPPGQIIHVFLGFSALLLHIVGDGGGEVVVGILPALPVGDVGFHTQHLPFHFPDCFIGGNRDNIDRQHHAPALICQLGDELIGDKGGIVL